MAKRLILLLLCILPSIMMHSLPPVYGSTKVSRAPMYGQAEQQAVKDSAVVESFALYYICDSIRVDENYLDNKAQLDKIRHYLLKSPRIDSITIYSWASPEGGYRHNKWLSQERGLEARRILLANTPDSSKLNAGKIRLSPLAENWPGLLRIVTEKYHRHDREKVLRILQADNIGDETRKWRLQQLDRGYTWKYLIRHYMPELRSATWICVWVDVPQISKVSEPKPILTSADPGIANRTEADDILPDKTKRTILGLKTNMLYDAVTALNYTIEIPINEHFSLQYEQHTPWWLSKNNKYCLEFLSFGGEFRWWFAPRTSQETSDRKLRDALVGHFLGVHCWGGKADIQWGRDFGCYQFDFMSAGLTYGYSMPISRHLNLEFSISAGYARIPYQHYIPTEDWQILIKDRNDAGTLHYFGPTKAEISLVIPIRATFNKKGGAR